MSEQPLISPRDGLRFILSRYDHGAMAPGVWRVAKELQRHLSWLQHVNRARMRDVPTPTAVVQQHGANSTHKS
jgi:hypothetical protein